MVKLSSPAAERNAAPILEVLERILPAEGAVLEIASGSGQHVVHFARARPLLTFQPSDAGFDALASIEARRLEAGLPNLLPALLLDVTRDPWPVSAADAVLAINMVHISPWAACEALVRGAARILRTGAPLYLYGPYRIEGRPTAPSNEAFDQSLRARNAAWGLRALDEVARLAAAAGFALDQVVDMPANNISAVFRRRE